VRRLAFLLAVAGAALAVGAPTASATNECRGFDVCVPLAGPWVLAPPARSVEFQLTCPRRFIVGGLDAELSSRAVDIVFLGKLGSPISPGVTSTNAAVFIGRFLGRAGMASFRPHVGCIPASGGGQRAPTALVRVFPPGTPAVRRVVQVAVHPGTTRRTAGCLRGQHLAAATHAVGFYRRTPPAAALASAVRATQRVRGGRVQLTVHAGGAIRGAHAVVQVDLVCAR